MPKSTPILFFREALRNPKTGEERYVYDTLTPGVQLVVKFFDPHSSDWDMTFKAFLGNYERVRSRWNTLTPIPANMLRDRLARQTVAKLMDHLQFPP